MSTAGNKSLSGKIKCVLLCLGIMAVMLLIQAIAIVIPLLSVAAGLIEESGGDIAAARELLTEYIKSNLSILSLVFLLGEFVSVAVAGLWYYFGYVKKEKARGSDHLPKEQENCSGIKKTGFILCGFMATWGLSAILNQIASSIFPEASQDLTEIFSLMKDGSVVLTLLAVALIGPIFEELTLRGIILSKLRRFFGPVGCIVISAVLFGIFHLNIIQGIYVFPMGLFWGFLAYRFKSVIPAIICHMANNFFGGVLSLFVNPIIAFIVFGPLTAFIGTKLDIFNLGNREELIHVEEI